jgi:hypothetical protein
MKNFFKTSLFFCVILLTLVSCKKDKEVDPRDAFVGTWKGTQREIVAELEVDESSTFTQIISKDPEYSNKIRLGWPNSDEYFSAKVNGNAYTYDEIIWTINQDGYTYNFVQNGGGSINGSVITEGGTLQVNVVGQQFRGTWQATLNKQ